MGESPAPAFCQPLQRFILLHDCDIAQVPEKLVVIQAEAHYEAVRNFEAAEIDRDLHDAPRVAIQKGADR